MMYILRWAITLLIAYVAGQIAKKIKLPAILGWLIAGMFLGPNAFAVLPQNLLDTAYYKNIVCWMQCAFGLMLGTELVWRKIKAYGKALMITTLTQSLGTFAIVSLVFAILFHFIGIPMYLGLVFGGIALATAPAPALSIVQEFHTNGPVTDTLLPMAVLDDIVGIVVFFSVNAIISGAASDGETSLFIIPVMIILPIIIGILPGVITGHILKKNVNKGCALILLIVGISATMLVGLLVNTWIITTVSLNYMLMGVSFSAVFSNMLSQQQLEKITDWFQHILNISLIIAIVDLGAPLDYHFIMGAGLYTFIYITARMIGKYFGARVGAKITHMPAAVQKYLGLTLLPHSGVSLVFTGIVCQTLESGKPELAVIVKGTIAAAAVINEIIAVIVAKKGFELAGEM